MKIFSRGNNSRRRIAAIGMFDGVHLGHRCLIDFLRSEGETRGLSPTVVTFAEHPLAKVRPGDCPLLLNTISQKTARLQLAGIADCVVLRFSERLRHLSARQFMQRLKTQYAVDALVVGFNNRFGHDRLRDFDSYCAIGAEVGVEVIAAPEFVKESCGCHVSSSAIRRMLQEGDLSQANELLGQPFALSGRVVEGQRLGRTLGYPTANIEPVVQGLLVPAEGVYAARVTLDDGSRHDCMANVGRRPTVTPEATGTVIEVHLFDWLGYIYGQEVEVEFVDRLRDERRFASLEKLKTQLAADERAARTILASAAATDPQ